MSRVNLETSYVAGTTYLDRLAAAIANGQDISSVSTEHLSRDQIKALRRAQAGLSPRPVGVSVAVPVAVTTPRARQSRRDPYSLYCSCVNCRSGRESLCLREG